MAELEIDRSFGRTAFGTDSANYHSARPPYPDWVFAALVERCGLADGTTRFEIGPGREQPPAGCLTLARGL